MKKIAIALCTITALVSAEQKMTVHYKDGSFHTGYVSDIDSVTFEESGISTVVYDRAEIFNAWASRPCAVDLTTGQTFTPVSIDNNGTPHFDGTDSSIIDLKTVNSFARSSELSKQLTSVNGGLFAPIDSSLFYNPDKSVIKSYGDMATKTSIDVQADSEFGEDTRYWVGKLSNDRGYVVLQITITTDYYDIVNTTQTGIAQLSYLHYSLDEM